MLHYSGVYMFNSFVVLTIHFVFITHNVYLSLNLKPVYNHLPVFQCMLYKDYLHVRLRRLKSSL